MVKVMVVGGGDGDDDGGEDGDGGEEGNGDEDEDGGGDQMAINSEEEEDGRGDDGGDGGHHPLLNISIPDAIPGISIHHLPSSSQQPCEAGTIILILEMKKLAQNSFYGCPSMIRRFRYFTLRRPAGRSPVIHRHPQTLPKAFCVPRS